jgi:8-oxo-dGTP pyrophosphatase MutT (NUDIX family)
MNDIIIFYKDRKILLTEKSQTVNEYAYSRERIGDTLKTFFENGSKKELVFDHDDLTVLMNDFKSFFTYIEAAGGLVRNPENQLLVIHRFGRPDLPKGKIEKNETPEDAAVREVEEECGIEAPMITRNAEPSYHIYFVKKERILKKTYWFYMTYSGNELLTPQLKEAIIAAEWCSSDKIKEYQKTTYPSIRKYFV